MKRLMLVVAAMAAMVVGAVEKSALKVLAIGNSYSSSVLNQLPSVAAAMGEPLDIMNLYHGSCRLQQHWDNHDKTEFYESFGKSFVTTPNAVADLTPANATLDQVLAAEKWDSFSTALAARAVTASSSSVSRSPATSASCCW